MSDAEFWEHVLGTGTRCVEDYPDPAHDALDAHLTEPCPECGEVGACGWDDEGRPLIHATPTTEDTNP